MPDDDRLFQLLPAIYRQRDAERGWPLRSLLRVIAGQVDVVEQDIAQLYENWFIETCQDWVVPYIGDLLGYEQIHGGGEPGSVTTVEGALRNRILFPRSEVANTVANRRRKGTLAILEALASETAGWPARPVEFYKLLGWTQHLNHPRPHRGRTVDLRDMHALDLLGTPFERLAHTVDVDRFNIPSLGLFVWRLKSYSVTATQAFCVDNRPNCYTFSILGNDTPLYTKPEREADPDDIDRELDVPVAIRRRAFEFRDANGALQANPDYYGPAKSLLVSVERDGVITPINAANVLPADLTHWRYEPPRDKVAVDVHLGRIAFRGEQKGDVWVSYRYGFSADMGGGEYERPVSQHKDAQILKVGHPLPTDPPGVKRFDTISDAIKAAKDIPHVVIEITDGRLYEEQIHVTVNAGNSFQIRAASGQRPIVEIPDRRAVRDALRVDLAEGAHFILDGLHIAGRAVHIRGEGKEERRPEVFIRHCTLVPGWMIDEHCHPMDAEEPSLELRDTCARVRIEHSILGSIEVTQNEVLTDPIPLWISDSIVDATREDTDAVSSGELCGTAYVEARIVRSTLIGHVHVHALKLGENSIFMGLLVVARRQIGCVRFCYVRPGSRTPRRYECQPDLVKQVPGADQEAEASRIIPQFNSTRYGSPVYCQLSLHCAVEITGGADDESEMGAFHDLFQPQRRANLQTRLREYVPASADAFIVYAS
jgi:hypothetical protein